VGVKPGWKISSINGEDMTTKDGEAVHDKFAEAVGTLILASDVPKKLDATDNRDGPGSPTASIFSCSTADANLTPRSETPRRMKRASTSWWG